MPPYDAPLPLHCFNLAIDWSYADTNPVSRVPLFHEDNKVEHYLSDEELAGLLHVLRTVQTVASV